MFRNRSKPFTQEDPIGLAGGMNAYGFAAGDRINFDDPMGLCPPKNYYEVFVCTGQILKPAQRPLEIAGMIVTAPLGGEVGGSVGLSTRVVSATEQSILRIGTKLGNQLSHVDRGHLSIAARELDGFASGWDHVTEVRDAMAGLQQTIGKLKNILGNPGLSGEERSLAQGMLGRASRALDAAEKSIKR